MTHSAQTTCLICGAPALDRSPTDWDGLKIECAACGRYAVADGVMDRLADQSVEGRRGVLEKARRWHRDEPFPMIDAHCFVGTT